MGGRKEFLREEKAETFIKIGRKRQEIGRKPPIFGQI
jgi:hypothetical protein